MRLAQFLEFLKDEAGDSLRAVEWYREGEAELIYIRDDLELGEMEERAEEIHEALTWDWTPPEAARIRELGDELATVSVRREAVLVHLPAGEEYGVVVGLEPEAARSLHRFVNDCRATLADLDA